MNRYQHHYTEVPTSLELSGKLHHLGVLGLQTLIQLEQHQQLGSARRETLVGSP